MIITVISFKGGVGKSTISQNLAVTMAHKGQDVCILDADPNESTTAWQEFRPEELPTVAVYPLGKSDPIKAINNLSSKYDIVIVDCPPAIESTTNKAVMKSDFSLVPIAPTGGGDYWATEKFLDNLELLRVKTDAELPAFFVVNRYESNTSLQKFVLEKLKDFEESHQMQTLETVIAKRTAYGEANIRGQGVIEGDNKKAKDEMQALIKEVETIIKKSK